MVCCSQYFLNVFEIVPVVPIITGIAFVFAFHMRCISIVRSLYFKIFSAPFIIIIIIIIIIIVVVIVTWMTMEEAGCFIVYTAYHCWTGSGFHPVINRRPFPR